MLLQASGVFKVSSTLELGFIEDQTCKLDRTCGFQTTLVHIPCGRDDDSLVAGFGYSHRNHRGILHSFTQSSLLDQVFRL